MTKLGHHREFSSRNPSKVNIGYPTIYVGMLKLHC